MFYIGDWDKQKVISHYIENNDVRKVLVVYNPRVPPTFTIPDNIPHEFLKFKDGMMYKNYYRLLQWVDKKTLIVSDELLITENRYALEYNCINAFLNQTPQKIVFSYFPFIENEKDIMILLDQYNSAFYKGEQFDYELIKMVKMQIKPVHLNVTVDMITTTTEEKAEYIKERDKRFAEIGMKDPDTIPRNLAILAGDIRAKHLDPNTDRKYLCRNVRMKKLNCTTYKDNELNTIMDFPTKRQDLIAVLYESKKTNLNVVTSDLSIDKWYMKDLNEWIEKLENFYAKTALS